MSVPSINPISLNYIPALKQKPSDTNINKDKKNNSALLYASLAALAAAGSTAGIVYFVKKGKLTNFHTLLKNNNLKLEKGSGILKNNEGENFTGILEYNTKGGKYLRKYENGQLVLSGKNIDKTGVPINDKVDYYKIEYKTENGRLRELNSEKRADGNCSYNSKNILTRKEKHIKLAAELAALEEKSTKLVNEIKELNEQINSLNIKKKKCEEIHNRLFSEYGTSIQIKDLPAEKRKGFLYLIQEYKNVIEEVKIYKAKRAQINKNLDAILKEFSVKNAELQKLIVQNKK